MLGKLLVNASWQVDPTLKEAVGYKLYEEFGTQLGIVSVLFWDGRMAFATNTPRIN